MAKKSYRIWRIDPAKRAIAPLALDVKVQNFALHLQRLCRAATLGHKFLCEVNGGKLCVAGDAGADDGGLGFRFRGITGTTSGIGVLFGQGGNGGLIGAPVDKEWIERHIVWTSPAETDADEEPADD